MRESLFEVAALAALTLGVLSFGGYDERTAGAAALFAVFNYMNNKESESEEQHDNRPPPS